jgi:hypothetical protein
MAIRKSQKEVWLRRLMTRTFRVVPGYPGPNYLKLLDKNYREKLFNLDNVQGKLSVKW